MPCRRIGMRFDFGRCAARNNLAAVLTRAWPHIDHVIRRAYHVLIVLNHDDGVVQIAQVFERFN